MEKKAKAPNSLSFKIDTRAYPLEAIYKTCYIFIDRAYLFLDGDPKREIRINLKGKKRLSQKELEKISGEFMNELLNNSLRISLGRETAKLREKIIGHAIFAAVSGSDSQEEDVFEADPLGIAVPWEEKYGKKNPKSKK